ncbi:MAG: metallophosphoesterase [Alphaproteobacteria bacterium]|nr:metallophosphoesterase [Alphaproteobacteria bacterium]
MIGIDVLPWQPAPASAGNRVLFAIGDSHAHTAHLEALHSWIRRRIQNEYDPRDVTVVWLGDYVDRGAEPYETLDLVNDGLGIPKVTEVRLMGNHEELMLQAINNHAESPEMFNLWMMNGGRETILGICGPHAPREGAALASALREGLGERLMLMLNRLSLVHREGNYLFVHGGVDPRVPLDRQDPETLIWIREPFLTGKGWRHDFVVVHGHTPAKPVIMPHRIGVDSGCYMTGRLTAVEIREDQARFIQARP